MFIGIHPVGVLGGCITHSSTCLDEHASKDLLALQRTPSQVSTAMAPLLSSDSVAGMTSLSRAGGVKAPATFRNSKVSGVGSHQVS